jgi:hypothetical protein
MAAEVDKERERRVMAVVRLLCMGYRVGQIKVIASEEWGIQPRSVEPYIAEARAEMRDALEEDTSQMVARHLEYYRRLMRDETVDARTRLQAARQVEDLMGMRHAVKVEVTGADGGPVVADFGDAVKAVMAKVSPECIEEGETEGGPGGHAGGAGEVPGGEGRVGSE